MPGYSYDEKIAQKPMCLHSLDLTKNHPRSPEQKDCPKYLWVSMCSEGTT